MTVAVALGGMDDALAMERRTLMPTSRGKIIGQHPLIRDVLETIKRVASTRSTVLITGESGTGKELVVAALHDSSEMKGPLVAVNCGAIPETLIESELFGHTKGAFTGAHAARVGRVAAAEGGTLFLDEVGELPASMQVKLLRLLQQREYTPVGENRAVRANVRIVAATNRDLEQEVAAGRFREDLYWRLNVIHVQLPSLRDRPDDIPLLVQHFVNHYAEVLGYGAVEVEPEAMEALLTYAWPGNIRALENTIERAVILCRDRRITREDLPERLRTTRTWSGAAPSKGSSIPDEGIDLRAAVEAYENTLIRQALERTGGNKNRAAQLLRVNRTTLVEMIKRKNL